MKIPFIPLHIVTSGTLIKKMKAAQAKGMTEGKNYSETQIVKLLSDNASGPVRIRGSKK